MNTWYTKSKAEDSQGLIIDETTGKNIAVSYDAKDAQLIAAAPDLLEACQHLRASLQWQGGVRYIIKDADLEPLRAAIAKATGE